MGYARSFYARIYGVNRAGDMQVIIAGLISSAFISPITINFVLLTISHNASEAGCIGRTFFGV